MACPASTAHGRAATLDQTRAGVPRCRQRLALDAKAAQSVEGKRAKTMAIPEHVTWFLEGVGRWNARRAQDPFKPDLSGENLTKALGGVHRTDVIDPASVDLRGVNLAGANLEGSTLRNTDMSGGHVFGARLAGADLEGSILTGWAIGACLRRTKLNHATLANVMVSRSDLTGAELRRANLRGATLFECTVDSAHLYNTDLTGVNFVRSRPWTARLFWPPSPDQITPTRLDMESVPTINDLLDACRKLRTAYGDDATLYFRGEARSSWDLRPSIMRAAEDGSCPFRSAEAGMLDDLMTREPEAFRPLESALGQWVFAQHHGLKTRLLDVTRNPLVALFNACEQHESEDGKLHVFAVPRSLIRSFNSDAIRVIANFAKLPRSEQNLLLGKTEAESTGDELPPDSHHPTTGPEQFTEAKVRLLANIRHEKPQFDEKIDVRDLLRVFVVEPQRMFDRLRAQSGAFLMSAFHDQFESAEVLKWNAEIPIYAHHVLRVPCEKETKMKLLEDLKLLNVTREVLMPGVDESARAVTKMRD